jgi:hypothetical protein
MKKIKKIAKALSIIGIVFLATNCTNEEIDRQQPTAQNTKIIEAKSWFTQYDSNGSNYDLFQNLAYDWTQANITKSEDGTETIIVPIIKLKEDEKEIWSQKLYLYNSDLGNYKALLFEIYPDKDAPPSSQTIDGGDFNGYIATWDLKTGFVKASRFKYNQVVENGIVTVLWKDKKSTSRAPIESPCNYGGPDGGCDKGSGDAAVPLRNVNIPPRNTSTAPTGTPGSYFGPRTAVTGGTNPGGFTSPGGGNGSGGSGNSSGVVAVIVDPSLAENPCLMAVYTKLSTLPAFQEFLRKFDSKFSAADLKLSVGPDPKYKEGSAYTYEPVNHLIEIKFNPTKLKSPELNIARTFAHEMLHAEMYRTLLLAAGQPSIPWSMEFITSIKDNYPEIADYYTRFRYELPIGQAPSEPQHEFIAARTRGLIYDILKQYDNTRTMDQYNALSWIGLMGEGQPNETTGLPPRPTVAWAMIPQDIRVKYLAIYNNFIKANEPCQK